MNFTPNSAVGALFWENNFHLTDQNLEHLSIFKPDSG